jgi:hypothetical protein
VRLSQLSLIIFIGTLVVVSKCVMVGTSVVVAVAISVDLVVGTLFKQLFL